MSEFSDRLVGPGTKSVWSASNGSSTNLNSLAVLLRDALGINEIQGHREAIFPPLSHRVFGSDSCQREVAVKLIRDTSRLDSWTFSVIHSVAARLISQGFPDAGSLVFLALAASFQNLMDPQLQYIRWQFEFVWEATGNRPASVPWPAPSAMELMEHGYGLEDMSMAMEALILEIIDVKTSLGDLPWYPYSLPTAAMLCVRNGNEARARKYINLESVLLANNFPAPDTDRSQI